VEDILAIIFIFGGGTAAIIAFSPIGRAIADAIRNRGQRHLPAEDPALRDEVEALRQEVAELHERVDFAERLLARHGDGDAPGLMPGARKDPG
jgi:hypothetical protein